jgi:hypothetical protein
VQFISKNQKLKMYNIVYIRIVFVSALVHRTYVIELKLILITTFLVVFLHCENWSIIGIKIHTAG